MTFAAFSAPSTWAALYNSKTVAQAVNAAKHILAQSRVPEPAASAQYLAISAFKAVKTRRAASSTKIKPQRDELENYIRLCRQRKEAHVPIQYLVGNWDFHHITLRVKAPVLIPRPETEELVEHVLADLQKDDAKILDVGCGSGAIMLAALRAKPHWEAVGLDVSQEAVDLTQDNIKELDLQGRAQVLFGSLPELETESKFDVLISNPPYIPAKEMRRLDRQVRDHEDFHALFGGEDGLDVIREILQHAPRLVAKGGSVWLEVDRNHPDVLRTEKLSGLEFKEMYEDLSGNPRFCHWHVI